MDRGGGIVAPMEPRETAEAFAKLFPEVYRLSCRRRDPRAPRVSGESLAVLQHLADSGPLTVTEAARHFDRSQASISERFARMLERGWLTRVTDDRDRRRHLVWLSEAGEEQLRVESSILSDELLLRATRGMPADDRAALVRGMEALIESARSGA